MVGTFIEHSAIERAMNHVLGELSEAGLLTRRLYSVDVVSQPIDLFAYAGCYVEDPGTIGRLAGFTPKTIYIPRTTFRRLALRLRRLERPFTSLRDVLRHEYGHAFAVEHPSLVRRSSRFVRSFEGRYDDNEAVSAFDPVKYVTEYAATRPAEDFAETFMTFVRCGGATDCYRHRRPVHRKLRFVAWLAREVGRRGWRRR